MILTLQDIPTELDAALHRKAAAGGKTVDEVAVEALRAGLGVDQQIDGRIDLSDIAGTWIEDPEVDAALRDQDRIAQ